VVHGNIIGIVDQMGDFSRRQEQIDKKPVRQYLLEAQSEVIREG